MSPGGMEKDKIENPHFLLESTTKCNILLEKPAKKRQKSRTTLTRPEHSTSCLLNDGANKENLHFDD